MGLDAHVGLATDGGVHLQLPPLDVPVRWVPLREPDGTITSYTWVFGDGTTGSGATVGHTYVAVGAYLATLTVTDNGGATGIQSQSVTVVVNDPPVASFAHDCRGLTCSFDGCRLLDADGTITSRAWSFGDGTTGSGTTVGHPYAAAGTYPVTLTVTDNGGATATQSQSVRVVDNAPPVASFTSACSGLTCTFNGSGSSDSDGTIEHYWWSFGDGAASSGSTASHTYTAAGTYTVWLQVRDSGVGANTSAQSQSVTVANAPPVASFTSACRGLTCSFDGSGSSDADGTITSRAWSFGDETTGSGTTVSHTYAAAGTYPVTLTVTDNGGVTAARNQYVFAAAAGDPVAGVVVSPDGGETWPIGSTQSIRWTSTGFAGNVKIQVSRDGGATWSLIVSSTANDGVHPWKVTGPATTQARIRVTSLTDPTVGDVSNASFTIGGGALTMLAPDGGQVWPIGSTQSIKWTSTGFAGNVKIQVSRDGGTTWSLIVSSTANDGVHPWKVKGPATTQATIRVTSLTDPTVGDVSNADFAIQ